MSVYLLIANILTLLAFFIHTFVGDKELKIIEPLSDDDPGFQKREKWTMARCGWHWISFDLLFASVGLIMINFTDYLGPEKVLLLKIMSIYFLGYAVFWAFIIGISRPFPKNYFKLGQWILLLAISFLLYQGTK